MEIECNSIREPNERNIVLRHFSVICCWWNCRVVKAFKNFKVCHDHKWLITNCFRSTTEVRSSNDHHFGVIIDIELSTVHIIYRDSFFLLICFSFVNLCIIPQQSHCNFIPFILDTKNGKTSKILHKMFDCFILLRSKV